MTNTEARSIANEILHNLKNAITLCSHKRVLLALSELLDEVRASNLGVCSPDQPLDTPWSLMDTSMLNLLRTQWLPNITGREALSDPELELTYSDPTVSAEEV